MRTNRDYSVRNLSGCARDLRSVSDKLIEKTKIK